MNPYDPPNEQQRKSGWLSRNVILLFVGVIVCVVTALIMGMIVVWYSIGAS